MTPGDDVLLVCDDNVQAAVQVPSFDDLHLPDLSDSETSRLLDLLSDSPIFLHLLLAQEVAQRQLSILYLLQGHQCASLYIGFQKLERNCSH